MLMANFKQYMTRYYWTLNLVVIMISFHRPAVTSPIPGGRPMDGNSEMKAIMMLRANLTDPNQVLQTWDTLLVNPCTFNHITCNPDNSVIRIDLGSEGLSGSLVPELAYLTNLQYLEIYNNKLTGPIPPELGALQNLISLDIFENDFSGPIPQSLGNLSSLNNFRAQNNSLSGPIPISLTNLANLQILELAYNELTGEVPNNGSFPSIIQTSFEGNPDLCGAMIGVPCQGKPPTRACSSRANSSRASSSGRLKRHKWEAWLWTTLVATLTFTCATISTHQWLDTLTQNPHPR